MPQVQCPKCKTRLNLDAAWSGKEGKCPNCQTVLRIPGPGADTTTAPAPSAAATPPPIPAAGRSADPRGTTPDSKPSELLSPRPWFLLTFSAVMVAALMMLVIALRITRTDPGDEKPAAKATDHHAASEAEGEVDRPSPIPEPDPTSSRPQDPTAPRPSARETPDAAAPYDPMPAPGPKGGLVGISRRYDDLDCGQIQSRHGVRIPRAATMIEVDGWRLPIADPGPVAAAAAPILLLPRGVHAVRFRPFESPIPVTIETDFFDEYQAMRRFFDVTGSLRHEELMGRGARAMDVHAAPFLLNFTGAFHAAEGRWAVAERKFSRALVVNPTFSPAHLNLAECLLRRGEANEALHECELAEAFNVQDVYGLATAVTQFRRKLGLAIDGRGPVDVEVGSYVTSEPLSEQDQRMTALLEGISKYAVRDEERGKILNNLAVHFADTGRPELALYHFRNALAVVKVAGPERFELATRIFSNMSNVCRKAGFDEADEYERMQQLVTP